MASKLCPECLSSVDSAAAECSACGAALHRRRGGGRWLGVLATVLALGGAAGGYLALRPRTAAGGTDGRAEQSRPDAPGPALAGDTNTERRTSHLWLHGERSSQRAWPALAITAPGRQRPALLLALDGLPLRGSLRARSPELRDSRPLPVGVLGYSIPLGLVLLDPLALPDEPLPEVSPLPAQGDLAERLEELAPGAGGTLSGPLDPLLAALDDPRPRPLDVVQEELRQWLPERLGPEVDQLLRDPAGPAPILEALDILARMRPRLSTPEDRRRLAERERRAFRLLVHTLAPTDRAEALARARAGLTRYPDHYGLLADTVMLLLTDDPAEALQLYVQLRAASPSHAGSIAEAVGSGLLRAAERRADAGRLAEASELLVGARNALPGREDLRDAYLRVVSAAEQAARPVRRVEIPIDPRTRSIRTEVMVAGHTMDFVVDTGATYTTLPEAVVTRLGLVREGRKVRVETASGTVDVDVVEVPWLTIGPLRVGKVRALVMDLPGSLAGKGLLGLNVLRQLNLELDSGGGKLILKAPAGGGR